MRLHASCVALNGRAVLIMGQSGTGKSALALQLMALGADLVSDDQTLLGIGENGPAAAPPAPLRGLIEARGVGLLRVPPADPAPVVLAVDLDQTETERLPHPRALDLLGTSVPLLHKVEGPHFAATLLEILKGRTIVR